MRRKIIEPIFGGKPTKVKEKVEEINSAKLELERIQGLIATENQTHNKMLDETLRIGSEIGVRTKMAQEADMYLANKTMMHNSLVVQINGLQNEYQNLDIAYKNLKISFDALEEDKAKRVEAIKLEYDSLKHDYDIDVSNAKDDLERIEYKCNEGEATFGKLNTDIISVQEQYEGMLGHIKEKETQLNELEAKIVERQAYLQKVKDTIEDTLKKLQENTFALIDKQQEVGKVIKALDKAKEDFADSAAQALALTKREKKVAEQAEYLKEQAKKVGITLKLPT